jgi:hypothetical protein
MLPTGRRKPAEPLLGKYLSVISPDMLAGKHRVELPPIKASKQVVRRAYPDSNYQLRILRVHAGDQSREFWSRNMVADPYRNALSGSGKCRKCALVCL